MFTNACISGGGFGWSLRKEKGLTQRNAVLVMYSATIVLGLFALCIVNAGDERVALILFLMGLCSFAFIRKLRCLDYLAVDKTVSRLKDVLPDSLLEIPSLKCYLSAGRYLQ